jgi:hypothetical protein
VDDRFLLQPTVGPQRFVRGVVLAFVVLPVVLGALDPAWWLVAGPIALLGALAGLQLFRLTGRGARAGRFEVGRDGITVHHDAYLKSPWRIGWSDIEALAFDGTPAGNDLTRRLGSGLRDLPVLARRGGGLLVELRVADRPIPTRPTRLTGAVRGPLPFIGGKGAIAGVRLAVEPERREQVRAAIARCSPNAQLAAGPSESDGTAAS